MTRDRSGESLRRYREASAALDERPSDATRAAILAAAARNVGAKPEAAGAPRSPLRRRWPLAAAATVLLSSLAVILASRTGQEMPAHTMQEEQAAMPSPRAPGELPRDNAVADRDSAETAAAAVPPQPRSDTAREPRAVERPAGAQSRSGDEPSVRTMIGPRREPGVADAAPEHPPAPAALPQAVLPPPPSAASSPALPAPPVPTPVPESAAPASGSTSPEASSRAAKPGAGQTASEVAGRSAGAAGSDRALSTEQMARRVAPAPWAQRDDAASKRAQRSAPEWLELIVRLRAEGRHAEADAELKRFRESYPEHEVPAAAQDPARVR
jgi:hypothetical protein